MGIPNLSEEQLEFLDKIQNRSKGAKGMKELKNFNVLVVDDEVSFREVLRNDLQEKGFNIFEAENGTKALEIIKAKKMDLVLTDIHMPNGDGMELLDKIKTFNPECPMVIIITGYSTHSLEKALEKGAEAIFIKPFDRQKLMTAIFRAINKGPIGQEKLFRLRNLDKVESDFPIELNFPELNRKIKGKVLNIGITGVFVSISDYFPPLGTMVFFKIELHLGNLSVLKGSGNVRWVGTQNTKDHPSGLVIEFYSLSEKSRNQILEYVLSKITNTYISEY